MTELTAYTLLEGPLRFDDEAQVAAVRFLREVRKFREELARCKRCRGEGVNRRGYACPWCAAGYSADVLRACGIDAKAEGPVLVEGKSDKGRIIRRLVDPLP